MGLVASGYTMRGLLTVSCAHVFGEFDGITQGVFNEMAPELSYGQIILIQTVVQ